MDGFESLEKYLCFSFLAISPLIMVRFEKFKNWHAAENVLCRDIVPIGGTSGHLGRNRDCPAEIGTVDMSDVCALKKIRYSQPSFGPLEF